MIKYNSKLLFFINSIKTPESSKEVVTPKVINASESSPNDPFKLLKIGSQRTIYIAPKKIKYNTNSFLFFSNLIDRFCLFFIITFCSYSAVYSFIFYLLLILISMLFYYYYTYIFFILKLIIFILNIFYAYNLLRHIYKKFIMKKIKNKPLKISKNNNSYYSSQVKGHRYFFYSDFLSGIQKYNQIPSLPVNLQILNDSLFIKIFKLLGIISICVWVSVDVSSWSSWAASLVSILRYLFLLYCILINTVEIFYPQYYMMVHPEVVVGLRTGLEIAGFFFGKMSKRTYYVIMTGGCLTAVCYDTAQGRLQKLLNTNTPVLTNMIGEFFMKPSGGELMERYREDMKNTFTRLQECRDSLRHSYMEGNINNEVYLQRKNYYENIYKIEASNFERLSTGEISISRLVGSYLYESIEGRFKDSPAYSATMPNSAAEGLVRAGNELGEKLEILAEKVAQQIKNIPEEALTGYMDPELKDTPLNSDGDSSLIAVVDLEKFENMQERAVVLYNKK